MKAENIDIITNRFELLSLQKKHAKKELILTDSKINMKHIEYILLGLPKTIYIDQRDENNWNIIDSEIVRTIFDYMEDKFRIDEPKYFPEIKGLKFSEIQRKYQRKIEDYSLDTVLIRPNTLDKEAEDLIKYIAK